MTKKNKTLRKDVTIIRGGRPWSERTIMVNRHGKPKVRIDPQLEYFMGTGVVLPRHCCVISFIAGIHSAGYTVYVNDYRSWKGPMYRIPARHTTFKPEGVYVPEYMDLGALWVTGKWDAHTAHTRRRGISLGEMTQLGLIRL